MNSFQAFSLQIARTGSLLGKSGIQSNIIGSVHLRSFSSLFLSRSGAEQKTLLQGSLTTRTEGDGAFQQSLWNHQQVRTKKRGTEYQPNNIKRKRTHGWIKRMRSPGGIEVILRRMLKGRKSLTH